MPKWLIAILRLLKEECRSAQNCECCELHGSDGKCILSSQAPCFWKLNVSLPKYLEKSLNILRLECRKYYDCDLCPIHLRGIGCQIVNVTPEAYDIGGVST